MCADEALISAPIFFESRDTQTHSVIDNFFKAVLNSANTIDSFRGTDDYLFWKLSVATLKQNVYSYFSNTCACFRALKLELLSRRIQRHIDMFH